MDGPKFWTDSVKCTGRGWLYLCGFVDVLVVCRFEQGSEPLAHENLEFPEE
jgi:hypothetical protein